MGKSRNLIEREEWSQYVERLDYFFVANNIVNGDKKRAIFLSVVGPKPYRMLTSLLSPEKPGEKSYHQLVEFLKKQYDPRPSEIKQRFKFHSRVRKADESVSSYVVELRSLAAFCNFGATLEVMLHDHLVCGINNKGIQNKLLAEADSTYGKALDIARSLKVAAQNLQDLRSTSRTP